MARWLNGRTWITVGGLLLTSFGFVSGWLTKEQMRWSQTATSAMRLNAVEIRGIEQAGFLARSVERLHLVEVETRASKEHLASVDRTLVEMQTDVREIRNFLLGRKP